MPVLLLTGAALMLAVVAFVGPADVSRSTFEWSASEHPLDLPLVLSATRPQSIEVRVPCELARLETAASGTTELFRTAAPPGRALTVATDGASLRAGVVGTGAVLAVPVASDGPCDGTVRFDIDDGRLQLAVDASVRETRLRREQQPVVTGLHAGPETEGSPLSARIVTQPTGSSPSSRQILSAAGAGVCLLVAGLLARLAPRRGARAAAGPGAWLRPADGVVAIAALGSAVLVPPSYDDGWVLATVRGFTDTGRFGGYFDREGASLVQGAWWDGLLYPFLSTTGNVVLLRLPFVVLTLATWWVLRRWVLDQWQDTDRTAARRAAVLAAAVVVPAWMTTLRPEPLIALLAAISMAATIRFSQLPSLWPLSTVLAAGALAMTTHQTGWVVLSVAAPVVLTLPRWLRTGGRARLVLVLAVVTGTAALALLLAGFDSDVAILRSDLADFRELGEYTYGPFDEWRRPHEVLVYHSAVRRLAVVLPALGLLGWVTVRNRPSQRDARHVSVWCAVCGYLGLLLTTSKFAWHYGAVMPCSVVLVGAGYSALMESGAGQRLRRVTAAGVLALLGAFALSASGTRWNGFDLAATGWSELRELDLLGGVDASRPVVWLAATALVGVALFALRALRRRPPDPTRPLLGISLAATCMVPVLLTVSLLVGDARDAEGWSFTKQMRDSLLGGDHCGLADELQIVTSSSPLPRAADEGATASPDAFAPTATNALVPARGADVWGTRVESVSGSAPDLATGSFTTPWYSAVEGAPLVFWTVGNAGAPNRVAIEARTADGTSSRTSVSGAATPYWAIHDVPGELRDAVALRLVLHDADPSGWLAATAPVRASYAPLAATLADDDRVWVAPEYYLYAPCADQPSIRNGYVHPFSVSLVTPPDYGTFAPLMSEAAVSEIGCADIEAPWFYLGNEVRPGQRPCAYRVDAADAAPLLVR